MNVLIVHNAYQHKGGEDMVMQAELAMLIEHGHAVDIFSRHNDAIKNMSMASLAVQTLWSLPVAREFKQKLETFKPDVIHVHNTFPLISPAIYWVAGAMGIPIVQTLHNFRLLCPQATFLRDSKACEDCLGHLPWRAVARACYRESKVQSTVLTGMLILHRVLGTWQNKVTRYIALNQFCREKFVQGGIPPGKIAIKPNFVDFELAADQPRSDFLYVGRFSPEKGIAVIQQAATLLSDVICDVNSDVKIRMAGSGPLCDDLAARDTLVLLGALTISEVKHEMSRAIALIIPSICFESFPRTLVEAYASGLPVIASRNGALEELVDEGVTGLLFETGNHEDLARKVSWAKENQLKMAEMGKNARIRYETEYTSSRNYQQLMAIYQDAITVSKENLIA